MSVIFSRCPRYFSIPQFSPELSLRFQLSINSDLKYTIIKNYVNGRVTIEYAELIRDFINIEYDNPNSWSVLVNYEYTTFDGLNATGQTVQNVASPGFFFSEGYGYFEEEENGTFTNNATLMQTNKTIYKFADAEVRIPIDRNVTDKVIYLYKGDIVSSETIASSPDFTFSYVGNNIDSFEDRVSKDANSVYEDTKCIRAFLDAFEINEVDEIRLESILGDLDIVKVKNIEECKYEPIKLSFLNRFGAIQDVWFFKKSIGSFQTNREKYNRFIVNPNGTYDTTKHQRKVFSTSTRKSIKLNTGYVDESYNDVMQELMQSEYVWSKIGDVVRPVNVKDNSLTFKTSVNDKLIEYSIELEDAFNAINNIR